MDRVPTGIPGFDDLVGGGFNANSSNLLAAGPGCGKTIFCMQFLWNGVTKFNEPGLFISFEETVEDLKKDALAFGWDFDKLEREGKLRMVYYHPYEMRDIHHELERNVTAIGAKRVVIDSSSVYGMTLESAFEVRKGLFELTSLLKRLNCVSIMTSEVVEGSTENSSKYSRFGVEEFLADSIIHISFESLGGQFSRSLIVRKMRRTKNDEDMHPLQIDERGITVHRIEA